MCTTDNKEKQVTKLKLPNRAPKSQNMIFFLADDYTITCATGTGSCNLLNVTWICHVTDEMRHNSISVLVAPIFEKQSQNFSKCVHSLRTKLIITIDPLMFLSNRKVWKSSLGRRNQWRNWRGGRGGGLPPWPVISKFLGPLSPHC